MERLIEGIPGERAAVWVQDRGGGPLRLREEIVIEDLSPVLTSLAASSGANGPLNPVTQYMLARAADHLAERLLDDSPVTRSGRDGVPRILSTSLGHQPFVEQVLGMSQHQMLRRWPLATDWYTDVINYVMRPVRFSPTHAALLDGLDGWAQLPLGEFVRRYGETMTTHRESEKMLRVAEALQALWPDYPPVARAVAVYQQQVQHLWLPIYEATLRAYGLVLRPGVSGHEVAWAMNALHARQTVEQLAGQDLDHTDADGRRWTMTAWTSLLLLAGACADADGTPLSAVDLCARLPVAPLTLHEE